MNSQIIISSIEFDFAQKTKTDYLNHFTFQNEGAIFDSVLLFEDLQRLKNLDIFYNLEQHINIQGEKADISYIGYEKRTLLPIINFGGIKENFWFQLGAFDGHFRGRGETFGAYYTYYDRSSINIFYKKPFIGSSNYGIESFMQKLSTREPVSFNGKEAIYDYDNLTFEVMGIYWANLKNRIKLGVAFLEEDYTKISEPVINEELPEYVNHKKLILKTKHEWGQINYYNNLLNGVDNQLFFETVLSSTTGVFWKFLNQLRAFKQFGTRHNLAARIRIGVSAQTNSPFVPFVLDSYINIRGSGNRVARGTGELVANLEYRYNLKETGWGTFQGIAFWDIGGWRPINKSFKEVFEKKNGTSFAGIGGRIYFKKIYNLNLRADFGFNLRKVKENGFVLGIGQYF